MREYPKYRKNHFIWHGIFILLSLYYTLFLILFCIAAHTVSDNSTLSDICLSLGVSNTAILLELPFITMYISIMLLYGILEIILKRFPIVPPSFIYLYSIYQFHVYFDVCFKQNKSLLVLSNKLFLCLLFIPLIIFILLSVLNRIKACWFFPTSFFFVYYLSHFVIRAVIFLFTTLFLTRNLHPFTWDNLIFFQLYSSNHCS